MRIPLLRKWKTDKKINIKILWFIRNNKKIAAFTLIELMVVIVILGILAAFIVPRVSKRPEDAKVTKDEVTYFISDVLLLRYEVLGYAIKLYILVMLLML